jgi:hypothetical protein
LGVIKQGLKLDGITLYTAGKRVLGIIGKRRRIEKIGRFFGA